jgi:hypothetical protein
MGLRYHKNVAEEETPAGPTVMMCGCCMGGCMCEDHAPGNEATECDYHRMEWGCYPASGLH